jgi:hypothetical protein
VTLTSEAWTLACRRLLQEAGRARIHDLRGGLNMAALGVELLADRTSLDVPGETGLQRAAGSVRRGVTSASVEVTGLHALIVETSEPACRSLADAARWALDAAEPVARRRAIDLVVPGPLAKLPEVRTPDRFAVVLAWLLVEVFVAMPRRSACLIDAGDGDSPGLTVEWPAPADADPSGCTQASDALAALVGGDGRVALGGDNGRRRLRCEIYGAAGHAPERQ